MVRSESQVSGVRDLNDPSAIDDAHDGRGRTDDSLRAPSPPPPPPPTENAIRHSDGSGFGQENVQANFVSQSQSGNEGGSDLVSSLLEDLGFAIAFEQVEAARISNALVRARNVAGRAAVALNSSSPLMPMAETVDGDLPTYHSANKQTDRNREIAEVELFARAVALALRLLLGLLQRMGLSEIRTALLLLGAETVSRRAERGLAGVGEVPVSLTEHNVGAIVSELSNALILSVEQQNAKSRMSQVGMDDATSYRSTNGRGSFSVSSYSSLSRNQPSSHMRNIKPPGPENLRVQVDGLTDIHDNGQPCSERLAAPMASFRSNGPVRGRLVPSEPKQDRGRSRFTRSRIVPPKFNHKKAQETFRADISWEKQLRSSSVDRNMRNSKSRSSLSPSRRSQTNSQSTASAFVPGKRAHQNLSSSSSNASNGSFSSRGIALVPPPSGRVLENTDLAAEMYVANLVQRSNYSYQEGNQQQTGTSPQKREITRSLSPRTHSSAPVSFSFSKSTQKSRISRKEAEAAARRLAAKDYGNFYSNLYARKQSRGRSPSHRKAMTPH